MRILCSPEGKTLTASGEALRVVLYGQAPEDLQGSAGAALLQRFQRERLVALPRAWDFMSLALSVITADLAAPRSDSPDGWTRELDLTVAVGDPEFWNGQRARIEGALAFLTTDRWRISFTDGGLQPEAPLKKGRITPPEDCVVFVSGGLDSLVGAIDLVAQGRRPYAVSQIVRGDAVKQERFAKSIGTGLRHIHFNHNAQVPQPEVSPSQRARSIIFLACGVLMATTLGAYGDKAPVPIFLSENGFIAINPPLTGARLGSLSTRTAHPVFLQGVQGILNAAQLNVAIVNPYQFMTKGEMLQRCANQELLRSLACVSTSCGRFLHFNYKQCGRCVPCQIRRAAFLAWGQSDATTYVYDNLGVDDDEHAGFDDVRAAAMAIAEVAAEGVDRWLGASLMSSSLPNAATLKTVVKRGIDELETLHSVYGIK